MGVVPWVPMAEALKHNAALQTFTLTTSLNLCTRLLILRQYCCLVHHCYLGPCPRLDLEALAPCLSLTLSH